MSNPLLQETIWFDKARVDDAERNYYEKLTGGGQKQEANTCSKKKSPPKSQPAPVNSIADEIARVRQHIKHSLQSVEVSCELGDNKGLYAEVEQLKKEKQELKITLEEVCAKVAKMEIRLQALEKSGPVVNGVSSAKPASKTATENKSNKQASKEEDDDDIDLFGSDNDDDNAANDLREKRLQEYAAKKSKKPALVPKSSVVLDVKPWDDETDMGQMEKQVRGIKMDGLTWGASKLVPLAYGIKKLQIVTVVEDEKVSIDLLQEMIEGLEDLVQSVDIAAFNKL